MARYKKDTQCVKCGEDDISTLYCPGWGKSDAKYGCCDSGEHIHRRCKNCGYEWNDEVLLESEAAHE